MTARYRVEVSKPAGKQIAGLDRTAQNRIIDRLTALGDNPRPAGSKKMAGPEAFWRGGENWASCVDTIPRVRYEYVLGRDSQFASPYRHCDPLRAYVRAGTAEPIRITR